jgi:RHS repeat-associated protein
MLGHLTHRLSLIALLGLLISVLPPASLVMQPVASAQSRLPQVEPQVSSPLAVSPIVDLHLPSLTVHLDMALDSVAVGDTVAFTLTVANGALDPAEDLLVTLPTPDGALALPGPNTVGSSQGWQWPLGQLGGRASTDVTGQLRLLRRPTGDALLLHAQASARGLDRPIHMISGALVTDRTLGAATMRFVPGATARLRSRDGRVQVDFPPHAFGRALMLRHDITPLVGASTRRSAGLRCSFGAFALDATDDAGQAVHQFTAPLTLTVSYTPEQLQALGIAEDDLTLSWFNVATNDWAPIPTRVDPATQTASAMVDHFSSFALSDGASPSNVFIPSLQGFQVSSFTGAANYNYPIDLPAGTGGLKPSVALSYSSAATDGAAGKRLTQQAGWVGLGWSLDTGSVAASKLRNGQVYYTLVVAGQSYDLLRGAALPGIPNPNPSDPTHWDWRPTDESFIRVRAVGNGVSTSTRGGFHNGIAYPRYTWQLWTKDGTRYDFSEDAWWGWHFCGETGDYAYMEAYKWLLSAITDSNGNTITYTYGRDAQTKAATCFHVQGTVDRDIWPATISWAGGRYKVEFVSSARANDTQFEGANNQYGGINGQPRQTRQLDAIRVWSNPAGSRQLVRQYNLAYDYSLTPDQPLCPSSCNANTAYPKLTLKSIQRVGNDGTSALPATTFGYGAFGVIAQGGVNYPAGAWNRLTSINNGQGGVLTLAYANVGQVLNNTLLYNQRRITGRALADGRGNSYVWSYSYGTANVNTLGATRGPQSPWGYSNYGTQSYPNSAALYYNAFNNSATDNQDWLAHTPLREFRGHDWVQETDPTGARVKHFFYQGEASDKCVPAATGGAILADACFQRLRDGEFLKGKEYKTQVLSASGSALLQETAHRFMVQFIDYTSAPLIGLWRAVSFESQIDQKQYEGGSAPVGSSTRFCYDTQQQGGAQYGNRTHTRVYAQLVTSAQNVVADCDQLGAAPTPLRIIRQDYAIVDTATQYMVDRVAQEAVFDGQRQLVALTEHFYDGSSTYGSLGGRGLRTLTCAYRDVAQSPMQAAAMGTSYDAWGNPTSTTSYSAWGQRNVSGSTVSCAAPAAGAARTTTTTYDSVFHAFPIQVTDPLNHIERADYDYRMGTLIRATGPNTSGTPTNCALASYIVPATEQSNCAQYDMFGRMVKLIKSGDSTTYPTVQALYYDSEQPFHYRVDMREVAGSTKARILQQFYDGLGRQIQVKREGPLGWQNIVVDTRYDGLNHPIEQSQARYSNETSTTFLQYTNPGSGALFNHTTTTYDALGRVRVVTAPDSSQTSTSYSLGSLGTTAAMVDANHHKTERETDMFGRLRTVREYNGSSTYTLYATTSYGYDALDRLTQVTDALSNITTLSYDSLGRKTRMRDPDMGLWSYSYDANGSLLMQTDVKGQMLWFGYDALNRLTQKRQTNSSGALLASYAYDQTSATNKGVGQRTAMMAPGGASSSWEYDARGRKTRATHTIPVGATNYTRAFGWAYDSADRLTQLTYPTMGSVTEHVSYTYDAAWRPTSACSDRASQPCYVGGATYTALDQPDQWTVGNKLLQDWIYSSPMQRLVRLKVGIGTPASMFDRSYTYDAGGNIQTIVDNKLSPPQTQNFAYDHRDRLLHAWTTGNATASYNESYNYNVIGNLLSKTGMGAYSYPASGPSSVRPHTPSAVNGAAYSYDANGNLVSGSGRTYTWTVENLPSSVGHVSGSESYTYDADGERVKKVRGSVTTLYYEGQWEEVAGGAAQIVYTFNGQAIAMRASNTNAVTYLHGDHLGSVSVATNMAGAIASQQEYMPWGTRRNGSIPQTTLNYTGQRLDGTGLLYYHARYYDPALGRFVSADSVVPGSGALTIGFDKETSTGPANPQDLNRYTYVNNNPINKTDPTGHCTGGGLLKTAWSVMSGDCTRRAAEAFRNAKTTDQKVVTGAVAVTSAVGMVAGWAGGTILALSGGEAVAGAVAGGGTTVAAVETSGAVTAATTACAETECGEEVTTIVSRGLINLGQVNLKSEALQIQTQRLLGTLSSEVGETTNHMTKLLSVLARRQEIVVDKLNKINTMPGDQLKGDTLDIIGKLFE